ncbi:MAG: tetratricopeptide repeat protein [Coriobacteriaceae bacterium]|jgi:tetratricopeptide (TPR) repeat protein|nr:tetratricopeptide repeat protein [Coriobacteriaceae bacterium]
MDAKELIADSHLAFLNQQDETALRLARQAIALDAKSPSGHRCAGNALMSLGRHEEAVQSYSRACGCDPGNGDRRFDLGYAQAAAGMLADASASLAQAEALGCTPENLARLYNLAGVICFETGRYADALANLEKAERLIGIDAEILLRKAVVYGLLGDTRNGLLTANRMKLIMPSDYRGYRLAYRLLRQEGRLDAAEGELRRARAHASLTMDYYGDCVSLQMERYRHDGVKERLDVALSAVEDALREAAPTAEEAAGCYVQAAEVYLEFGNPDRAIACLDAAKNPAWSYNRGFEIIPAAAPPVLTEYDVEDMIAADCERIAEELGEHGLEELVEGTEQNEDGSRDYLIGLDDTLPREVPAHRLDEEAQVPPSPEVTDRMNQLYTAAYTMKQDFKEAASFARLLQLSAVPQFNYIGRYAEADALRRLGAPEAQERYAEAIHFFKCAMLKDPTDILAVTFRIQCCIDTEDYDEAERLCGLLSKSIRESLLETIAKAREGGSEL